MRNVILFGGSGLLGYEVLQAFTKSGFNVIAPTSRELDLTNTDGVIRFFNTVCEKRIEAVINCAGYTNVDDAQLDYERCNLVNNVSAKTVADLCSIYNIPLVHVSSNYVFDGELDLGREYTEDCEPNPKYEYAISKYRGEVAIKDSRVNYWIIRTGWLFGKTRDGFISKIVDRAYNSRPITIDFNQYGSPTSAENLAYKILAIVNKKVPFGIYNLVNSGNTNTIDLVKSIRKIVHPRYENRKSTIYVNEKESIRPKNTMLCSKKSQSVGLYMPTYESALMVYLDYLKQTRYTQINQ